MIFFWIRDEHLFESGKTCKSELNTLVIGRKQVLLRLIENFIRYATKSEIVNRVSSLLLPKSYSKNK